MKQGDYVEVECSDESIQGILMPSSDDQKEYTVIKLSSGYNIGIHKRNIKGITLLEEKKQGKENNEENRSAIKQNEKLPKITILHTGGTIASKVDYESGAVNAKFSPDELLSLFPELSEIANIDSRLVANMLSENMNFLHYNSLANAIKEEIEKEAQGIIITHGTDTMHYTSAALSFMLENLNIPVILTGAQRSSDRGSSDASANIIAATAFAANSNFAGVAVCMHENEDDKNCIIIDGLHARKMHSSKRDAFKSVNREIIARVNYTNKKINYVKMPEASKSEIPLVVKSFNPKIKIGILKVHPNMSEDELDFKHFHGVLIEGTGLGHMPIEESDDYTKINKKIFKKLEELSKKIPIAMASQAIFGRINMNVYSPGRALKKIGILGDGLDMTPETAFIKLAWLLSNFDGKQARKLYQENLRGEITERSENGEKQKKKK